MCSPQMKKVRTGRTLSCLCTCVRTYGNHEVGKQVRKVGMADTIISGDIGVKLQRCEPEPVSTGEQTQLD